MSSQRLSSGALHKHAAKRMEINTYGIELDYIGISMDIEGALDGDVDW